MRANSHRHVLDGPWLLRAAAMVALAIGAGVGAAVLLAPDARPAHLLAVTPSVASPETDRVAQWFGGAALRVRVVAHGVIASQGGEGAALLSVNGAAPRAYRVGQTLAPGVVLSAVGFDSVMVSQDGTQDSVPMAKPAIAPVRGFLPVSSDTTARP